jgi:hypothetical protein
VFHDSGRILIVLNGGSPCEHNAAGSGFSDIAEEFYEELIGVI